MKYLKYTNLTDWFSGKDYVPRHVGEYNASVFMQPNLLRWWNGEYWSEPYMETYSADAKARLRRRRARTPNNCMMFRGLTHKPKMHSILYLQPLK